MDQTGCSSSFATDNWIVQHPLSPCQVPLAAFIVVLALLTFVKAYVVVRVWIFWLKRRADMRKGARKAAFMNRYPVVPTLLTTVVFTYALQLILVATNSVNAYNGGGTVLYAIAAFFWGGYCLFHVKKYVSLGRKLIPLALVQGPPSGNVNSSSSNDKSAVEIEGHQHAISQSAEKTLSLLNTFDRGLQILVGLMGLSLILMLVIAFIPGLIYPGDDLWPRFVFGLVGAFALFLEITLIYHLERLVNATKICMESIGASNGANTIKLKHAIKIMRTSQLVWFISGNITSLIHLLVACKVIDLSWIFVLCVLGIETTASTFAYFATRSRAKKSSTKTESSTGKDAPTNALTPHARDVTSGEKATLVQTASRGVGNGSSIFLANESVNQQGVPVE
jgi:hypothetical protein